MEPAEIRLERLLRNFRLLAEALVLAKPLLGKLPNDQDGIETQVAAITGSRPALSIVTTKGSGDDRAKALSRILSADWSVSVLGVEPVNASTVIDDPMGNLGWLPRATALAAAQECGAVIVIGTDSRALLLGALIKDHRSCPLILDLDEREADIAPPLARAADTIIAARGKLAMKYEGFLVRSAREFPPETMSAEKRRSARADLRISDEEFAILYIGDSAPDDDISTVADAVARSKFLQLVFHIVPGKHDPELEQRLKRLNHARVVLHAPRSKQRRLALLAAADAVAAMQDMRHPAAEGRIPEEMIEGLARGIPVLAAPSLSSAEFAGSGKLLRLRPEQLNTDGLARLIAEAAEGQRVGNRLVTVEFGHEVNRARLAAALTAAQSGTVASDAPSLVDTFIEEYRTRRAAAGTGVSNTARVAAKPARQKSYDFAIFWKQNDSGIYGRRSDMITKYLHLSGRARRIVHFDAPVSLDYYLALAERDETAGDRREQDAILQNFAERLVGAGDTEQLHRRVFLCSDRPGERLLGRALPGKDGLVDFVRHELARMDMDPSTTLAWVYPVSWDFAVIADAIPFRGTIADVVDDERAWATASEVQRVDANYREILSRAQLTFTNCRPLAESLAEYAMDIRVVPNGAESPEDFARVTGPKPAKLRKPVIGYVGDLRNRIDWELVRKIAEGRREWSIVLVGPGRGSPQAKVLSALPNVTFAGTVPYAEIPQWLTLFDVAVLPHTVDRITSCMNPLKAYQYLANGLPVVSTNIQNLSDVGDLVTVAATHREFIMAVEKALKAPRPAKPALQMLMSKIGWTSRLNSMMEAIDEVFG